MKYYVSLTPDDAAYKDYIWNKINHGLSDKYDHSFIELLNYQGIEAKLANGGWSDLNMNTVKPHLVFDSSEMAAVYVLKYGGVVLNREPVWTDR